MGKLNPLEGSMEFYIPKTSKSKRAKLSAPDYLILTRAKATPKNGRKHNISQLKFTKSVLNEHWETGEDGKFPADLKVTVSFNKNGEKRVILVFDPQAKGYPFFKLSKSGSNMVINNKDFVEYLYEYWGLDKDKENYLVKVREWAEWNGDIMYIATPHHYDTKLPVFEDELYGKEKAFPLAEKVDA